MTDTARLTTALAGRYAIERELGAGGMATVHLARDLKHDRDVALKVLRPELAAVLGAERFLQEIRISARLDHPHILTLIDSGESDGFVWYVLPYVRGESLREKLTREQQLSIEEAVRIATQVASALDYAHHHGVIHRDIKPENILLHQGDAGGGDVGSAAGVRWWTAPRRGRWGWHRGGAGHRGGPLARGARGGKPKGPRLRGARPLAAHVHGERDKSGDLWGRQAGGVRGQALHRRHLLLRNRDSGRGWWREPPCYRRRHGAVQHQVEPRPSLSDLCGDHRVALRELHRIHAAWDASVSGDRYGDVLPRRRLPARDAISKPREHRVGVDHDAGWRSPRQHPDRGCEPPSGGPGRRRPLDGRPVVDG